MKKKKKIDLERIIDRFSLLSNACVMFPLAIVNGFCIHNSWISGIVIGWCMCLTVVSCISFYVGNRNFKYEMNEFNELLQQMNELRVKESELHGEIQSGGK